MRFPRSNSGFSRAILDRFDYNETGNAGLGRHPGYSS